MAKRGNGKYGDSVLMLMHVLPGWHSFPNRTLDTGRGHRTRDGSPKTFGRSSEAERARLVEARKREVASGKWLASLPPPPPPPSPPSLPSFTWCHFTHGDIEEPLPSPPPPSPFPSPLSPPTLKPCTPAATDESSPSPTCDFLSPAVVATS